MILAEQTNLIGTDGAEPLNSARYLGQRAAPPTDAERSPSKLTLAATTATRDLHPCPRRYIAIIYTHLKRTVAVAAMPRWAAESSSFNSQPGTWRTFQIITRLEITNPEGNTQTLVPVPAVKADWFKSLGNEGEESASQRAARRHARHEIGPIELGECPGNRRRLFGAQVYDGKRVDDTGPDFIARSGNAMGGPDEIAAHLRRSEFRFRRQQQCRNPAHMGRGN